jgi:iron complex outermembrane receptor protein
LRLSVSGNNLFTLTGYDGIDPEVSFVDEVDGGPLAPGIERRNNWFTARSFTFGVNLEF